MKKLPNHWWARWCDATGFHGNRWPLKNSLIALSPGQTDSQVVASSHKLNMRRDWGWVAKQIRKFPRKHTKVAKNPFQSRQILHFIGWSQVNGCHSAQLARLGLGGQTVKNLRRLGCKFDLDQSERKSSQWQRKCTQGLAKRSRN